MLDNSKLVAPFCPPTEDGDTFIYTEMLDRGKKKGNNGHRLVKTFYHRSVQEFWEQWPNIQKLCDLVMVRACTRLAPKSYRKVGATFTRMVVEASLTDNFAGMKSLYNRACGVTSPNKKLWLFDIDIINDGTIEFEQFLKNNGSHVATIPSKKGRHYITNPFDKRLFEEFKTNHELTKEHLDVHFDNPTNLYIPEGAD
jgi:hypothetical protein